MPKKKKKEDKPDVSFNINLNVNESAISHAINIAKARARYPGAKIFGNGEGYMCMHYDAESKRLDLFNSDRSSLRVDAVFLHDGNHLCICMGMLEIMNHYQVRKFYAKEVQVVTVEDLEEQIREGK